MFLLALTFSSAAFGDGSGPRAFDREQDFRKGRGRERGNERSERPGRFQQGQVRFVGNGCPAGSMRVVWAPDLLSFTILFDQFVADNSDARGRRDRTSCVAELPLEIPEGQQIEITRVDYRGFVSIPVGGRGNHHSVFNFVDVDQRGRNQRDRDRINLRFQFRGPIEEGYELSSGDMAGGRKRPETEVSPCGGPALLKVKNDVTVVSPRGQAAMLTVDSVDGSANAIYYVNWRACRSEGRGENRGGRR